MEDYQRVIAGLRQAYGEAAAAERDSAQKEAFKLDERRRFLDAIRDRNGTSLLEVGAGTGHDSLYFQDHGLRVRCTDLSPAMVERCQAKGLDAHVADFLSLGVPAASFDAATKCGSLPGVIRVTPAAVTGMISTIRFTS